MSHVGIVEIYAGKNIPAIERIKLFSPNDWESFVEEWLFIKREAYESIEQLGGAGDQGRDVIGIIDADSWENFQCKHYDHPLMPSDVWVEFGKLIYYTFKKEFTPPIKYSFVAPQGVGTTLSNLLKKPLKLKEELVLNWGKYCEDKITKTEKVPLTNELKSYLDNFDFSIFDKITPLTLLNEHSKSRFHVSRFGGGLPERPPIPPISEGKQEQPFVKNLLSAYTSESNIEYESSDHICAKYSGHLKRSRENFHHAEQLKGFSRDSLPPGVFESLENEIYDGIVDTYESEHGNGFLRVKEVERESKIIAITSNPLVLCMTVKDRIGICHHISNNGTFDWVKGN